MLHLFQLGFLNNMHLMGWVKPIVLIFFLKMCILLLHSICLHVINLLVKNHKIHPKTTNSSQAITLLSLHQLAATSYLPLKSKPNTHLPHQNLLHPSTP